jgi:predicted O-methyltransferase YrrM
MNPDQITGRTAVFEAAVASAPDTPLARALRGFVARTRPRRILELGTGTGVEATLTLCQALHDNALPVDGLYSIERDAGLYAQACENLATRGFAPHLLHGMSIPRGLVSSVTAAPEVVDDLAGYVLRAFTPDLVLVHAAESLGVVEFDYALSLIRSRSYVVLSDLYHVRGYRILQMMQNDERFQILDLARAHFGYCIAQFDPA